MNAHPIPLNLRPRSALRAHQTKIIRHIKKNSRVYIAAEPGTGKTAPTLHVIADFVNRYPNQKVLIIGPKAVVLNVWGQEAARWEDTSSITLHKLWEKEGQQALLQDKAGTYLVNYERLSFITENSKCIRPFVITVIDEAQCVKSRSAKRSQLTMAISKHSQFVVALSGTPSPQGLPDLYAQMKIVRPEPGEVPPFSAWVARYCTEHNGKFYDRPEAPQTLLSDYKDVIIAFRASELTDMPDRVEQNIYIDLPRTVKEQIAELESTLTAHLDEGVVELAHERAIVMKLEQLMSGRILSGMPGDEDRKVLVAHDEKMCALEDLIESLGGTPLLIFARFRADVSEMLRRLPAVAALDSSNVHEVIEGLADGSIRNVVSMPQSTGHGVDGLQKHIHHVCYYSQVWSGALRGQSEGRLIRTGQEQGTVYVHNIVARGEHVENARGDTYYQRSLDELALARVHGLISQQETLLETIARHALGEQSSQDERKKWAEKVNAARKRMQDTHPDRPDGDHDEFIKARKEFESLRINEPTEEN